MYKNILFSDIVLIEDENQFTLYNYKKKEIVAHLSTLDGVGYIIFHEVAAEKGFGPIIHDIAMMSNFPRDVISDDHLTDAALGVWDYYFDKRTDVTASPIPHQLISNSTYSYESESVLYSYRQEPKKWFIDFRKASKEIIFDYNIEVDDILHVSTDYFMKKYGEVEI